MAVAPAFRSVAVQAILGPARSQVVPASLWVGWLDAAGELIAMSGTRAEHGDFGPAVDGVQNTVPLACGVAGSGWEIHAACLFADAAGSSPILTADFAAPVTPAPGEPLTFDTGGLKFTIAADA